MIAGRQGPASEALNAPSADTPVANFGGGRESEMPGDDRYVGALRLVYGHAITCNKAQGGEGRKVFINTLGIPNLKWQYTAVTRGIDEIEKF